MMHSSNYSIVSLFFVFFSAFLALTDAQSSSTGPSFTVSPSSTGPSSIASSSTGGSVANFTSTPFPPSTTGPAVNFTTTTRPSTTTVPPPTSEAFVIQWAPLNATVPRIIFANNANLQAVVFPFGTAPSPRSQFFWRGDSIVLINTNSCLEKWSNVVDLWPCSSTAPNDIQWQLRVNKHRGKFLFENPNPFTNVSRCMQVANGGVSINNAICNENDESQLFDILPVRNIVTTPVPTTTTPPIPTNHQWFVVFSFTGINDNNRAAAAPATWNEAVQEFTERLSIFPHGLNNSNFFYSFATEGDALEFIAFIIGRFDANRRGSVSAWKFYLDPTNTNNPQGKPAIFI